MLCARTISIVNWDLIPDVVRLKS